MNIGSTPGTITRCPGATFSFIWSVGNFGPDTTFDVNFYLSTDTTIATSDILAGSNTGVFMPSHLFWGFPKTITIPATAVRGQTYRLGYFIDPFYATQDHLRTNNTTFLPTSIRICP
jgi:hypothetical protein